jgi:uncharacterized protein
MISALAVGGRVLGETRYVAAAVRAADFILAEMRPGGRLQRSWKDGRSSGPGFLEDDAFFVAGLLDLYEATFDRRWLADALMLADATERLFADVEGGGWFRSAGDHERLLAREKPSQDGAEPAGASVALLNVLRLHAITGDDAWRRIAERAMRLYVPMLQEQPAALHEMLLAVDFFVAPVPQIVLVWPAGEGVPSALIDPLRRMFLPNHALLGAAEGMKLDALAKLAPPAGGKTALEVTATAYVCERGACRLPTTEPSTMTAQIEAVAFRH